MSEPYRPPGSGDRKGLGGAAKLLISVLIVAVLGLVVALGAGANMLVERWNEFAAAARGSVAESGDESADGSGADSSDSARQESDDQDKLTAEEIFSGAADEKLTVTRDDYTAHARRTGRWNHQDCSDAGGPRVQAVLQRHGCQYRVEQAIAAADSPIQIGNQVLVFPDEASATAAAEQLEDDQLYFRIDGFDRQHHTSLSAVRDQFLIASTIVIDTEDGAVTGPTFQKDASTLFGVIHADLVSYFIWR